MDSLYSIATTTSDADSSTLMIERLLKQTRANHYQSGTLKLLLLKAVNLYNSGKFDIALKETYNIEQEVRETKDFAKISHLLALRANCYGNLFYFDKSKNCLKESTFYAEKIKDEDEKYNCLGRIYRLTSLNIKTNTSVPVNNDSVMYYRKKAYNVQLLIKRKHSNQGLVVDAAAVGELYLEAGRLDSAKSYFLIAQKLVKITKAYKFGIEPIYGLGVIFDKQNQTNSALAYFNSGLKMSQKAKRIGNIKRGYQLLSALYNKMGDKKMAQDYANKFAMITDSIANAHKKASTITADLIIKDNETLHSKSKKNYMLIIAIAAIVILLTTIAFVLLRKKYFKSVKTHKEEKNLLNKKFDDLQVDKLSDEILKEINGLVKTNDAAFYSKFKEHHPIFIHKLTQKSPDMLASDLDLCAKLKLGFNTKEIAYYSKSSQRAVESRKYRIRKKLGLSPDDDMGTWVMNL
ncbi:hypothetical protein [Pedobacter aquatilis]|uniref:tetratricopeptide repeat protein n=1 Tax=Pedobacter aquatilis TaxID=351343 RepID=UPI0029312BD8|nr:hypothetical protein [Pedobacter aquatilis]